MIKTAEFITPKHPDKICDLIADTILDAYLTEDPNSRVAVEVMGGHGKVMVTGEVTSTASVNIVDIVKSIEGEHTEVDVLIDRQSPFIAQGVDIGGAGDQGIMVGFACNETLNFMPLEYETARKLCQEIYKTYPYDGKVQVTMEGNKVLTVVASFQNSPSADLEKIVRELVAADTYLINPAGEWNQGGFEADSGLSGRKLVVDSYGPQVPIGGGSFSGKDFTKVDRSGAYMARKIAVDLLQKHGCQNVTVKLAYAIGKVEPVMAMATVDGSIQEVVIEGYDLSPAGIKKALDLPSIKYAETAVWGHFGRSFSWDR